MIKRFDEFKGKEALKLRDKPIELEEALPQAGAAAGGAAAAAPGALPAGVTNTQGWTQEQVVAKLKKLRKILDWDNTTGSARKWWEAFKAEQNSHGARAPACKSLGNRKATITEFFLAYVYSNTDNIQANLCYLDYTRLKKDEEKKKELGQAREAAGQGTPPPGSASGGGQAAA